MSVAEIVRQAVLPYLEEIGCELVDVEFAKKYGQDNLTVYVYFEGGTTLDDCERVHNLLDPVLDELNPTNDKPYVFNVSSPGLDRPFKTQRDFERNYGTEVELKLYAPIKGKKLYEGVLVSRDENTIVLEIDGKTEQFSCNRAAYVRPLVKFG